MSTSPPAPPGPQFNVAHVSCAAANSASHHTTNIESGGRGGRFSTNIESGGRGSFISGQLVRGTYLFFQAISQNIILGIFFAMGVVGSFLGQVVGQRYGKVGVLVVIAGVDED